MAVQAQFGGSFAGSLPLWGGSEQIWAVKDYGAGALQFAAANNGYHCPPGVVSGAQSDLTCNGSGGGGLLLQSSRKRGREEADHLEQYVSSAALLPIPTMQKTSRVVDSATPSTSGRTAVALLSAQDALVSELRRHGAEIDALVRAECERLRAGLEHARKRQRHELARFVAGGAAARRLREKEAELDAARRRNAELEERLRQEAAESRAWCGLARGHEAVAAELRAALDHHQLLLRSAAVAPAAVGIEGFGESAAAHDAQSCCCVEAKDATSAAGKWACRACGEGEASVLLLPCRHLCLCKACDHRMDACPVCLATKNASIHVAPN